MKRSRVIPSALAALLLLGAPRSLAAGEAPASGAPPSAVPEKAAPPPETTPAAMAVYEKARAEAGKRGVFLAFHASWCVWCKALEKLTLLPGTKAVFDRYYAVAWLTVDERNSRKALENPGADELRTRLGCDGVALPFYVTIDAAGKVAGSSVRTFPGGQKENVGFPATHEEIGAFLDVFRAAAPDLTADEEQALRKGLAELARR